MSCHSPCPLCDRVPGRTEWKWNTADALLPQLRKMVQWEHGDTLVPQCLLSEGEGLWLRRDTRTWGLRGFGDTQQSLKKNGKGKHQKPAEEDPHHGPVPL